MIYNSTKIYFVCTHARLFTNQIEGNETHAVSTIFSVLTFPDATYSDPSLTTFSNPSSNFFTETYFNFH